MANIIAHLDMDAFFAAVEERDNPRWKGMPIVVGADPKEGRGRGVVSTANYAARKFGIRSALPIGTAWRLAPHAIFLPGNFRRYGEVSRQVMAVAARHARTIEQASVDEAYLDLSACGTFPRAAAAMRLMKREVKEVTGLTCSVGIGANKTIAKIASDFKKPDGLTVVPPGTAVEFLAPLDVRKIPGIGPKAEAALKRRGVATVAQLQSLTEADLWQMLGEWGLDLYEKARGGGSTELVTEWTAKSVGAEETFDEDTSDARQLGECLARMSSSVVRAAKKDGFVSFRRAVLKVRLADFTTCTRSRTLAEPADSADALRTTGMRLLLPFLDRRENPKGQKLRLIGIRVEDLK